ncbi:hypothetical protein SLS62_002162 [Diatrype stigma]|uniref:Up-regulated during septation protein 1 domain-containing protein n=1 Tax=Diatrype stigma TaxID=117547 RepID=A0AAN9V0S3_9PEZI
MNGYNGYTHRGQDSFDAAVPQALRPSPTPSRPPTRGAYSRDSSYSFGQEDSRFALMDDDRTQAPAVDLKDPVQVHLLTETALLDSKEFEILSQEEADALKKRCQALNKRIEQTRSNLAIQSKYRDAAVSMSKLYSTGKSDSPRRSLLGGRSRADSDAAREAEAEREATQKKCDDLTAELRSLEKRAMEPQRRLLEHTAGILQFAHKKSKKPSTPAPKVPLVNGVPASPESMYTTSNGRNSLEAVDDFFIFDQGSLYQSFDQLDLYGGGVPRTSPLEIPAKSPSRENKLLADENEKLRQENDELRAQMDSLTAELDGFRGGGSNQYKLITDTEAKLERLNNQLREQIMNADPARNENYKVPPSGQLEPGDMIGSHLDYLENGIYALSEGLRNANPAGEQQSDQSDRILIGLWEKIQTGYADIRQKKLERRKARLDKGMEVDEEDVSEGESFDADEPYSLIAFESRVQWLYAQATGLQEQKGVLKRQIKQQRELNSRSDSEKDEAYRAKVDELEQAQQALMNAEAETDMIRAELSQALEDLNNLQRNHSEEGAMIDEAQAALRVRNQKIASLEAQLKEVQPRLAAADANIEAITAQLQQVNEAKEAAEKAAEETRAEAESRQKEIDAKQGELAEVTGMVAELKMEAALAKAELDGAYGSRKERAAEAAAAYDSSEEGAKMKNRIDALERELRGTAKDLADVVQQSLEYERQMRGLETELDKVTAERARLRDERSRAAAELDRAVREAATDAEERLGSEIARLRKDRDALQEELDGERLKSGSAPPLSPGGAPRTSYLTEQYRTGLRAERKRYEEQMRTELMARRKVEDELRALKKAQGIGGGAEKAGAGTGAAAPLRSPSALSPPPR